MKKCNFANSLQFYKGRCNFPVSEVSSKIPMQIDCSNANHKTECKEPLWKCRFVAVLIGFFNLFYVSGYRLNLSVTLVDMVNNTALADKTSVKSQSCPSLISDTAEERRAYEMGAKNGEFIWSPKIQGYILSSFYLGYLIMLIPAGVLTERFGTKWLVFSASFISGFCTLMIPALSRISAYAFIAVNVVRGLAQGFIQPAVSVLTPNWFPKMERGLLFTITYSGYPFGSVFTSIFSGLLCEYAGWPSSFYTFGCSGILLSICILFFLHESPNSHPSISKAERDFIVNNQECVLSERRPNVPWKKMLTSLPVLALLLGSFGQAWAFSQFFIVHSTYLGTILHYPIRQNGLLSALPFLLQFFVVQTSAFVSSYLQKKSIATVDSLRKLNTLFSSLGYSACVIGIYLAGCDRNLSILFGILSMGFAGMSFAGVWIAAVDMTPQFGGSLSALALSFSSSSSIILPLVVGYLTDEMQTIEQWNKVMFISIGVVVTTGIFFMIFGSAEVQPWNFVEVPEPGNYEKIKGSDNKEEREITRF